MAYKIYFKNMLRYLVSPLRLIAMISVAAIMMVSSHFLSTNSDLILDFLLGFLGAIIGTTSYFAFYDYKNWEWRE